MATTTVYCGGAQIAQNDTDIATNVSDISNLAGGVNANATHTVGTPLTLSGLVVTEMGDGAMHKTVFTFTESNMDITDGTTPGTDGAWGTLELYTFPEAHIRILGVHAVFPLAGLEATTGGGTGLSDTADFEIGIGSAASGQASAFGLEDGDQEDHLTALDVDLTAGTSDAIETGINDTAATVDGSTAAETLNLNVRCLGDDDSGVTADVLKITGVITVLWSSLGDD